MKIAILIAGEYREFAIAHKFWSFLNWENVDCYFSTWDDSYRILGKLEYTRILETITDQDILNIIPKCKIDIGYYQKVNDTAWHSSSLMINRWKKAINMMSSSGIEYDRVILIRPDLALKYDEDIFKNFMYSYPIDDSSLHGLTASGTLDQDQNLKSLGQMSDLLLIGTYNGILKLLNIPEDDLQSSASEYKDINIHSFLAKHCGKIYDNFYNSPIDDMFVIRNNSRDQPLLTFDEYKLQSREWWESRYKIYYFMNTNHWKKEGHFGPLPPSQSKTQSINLWNKYDLSPWEESNRVLQWKHPDSEIDYDINVKKSKFKNEITYGKNEFSYDYDSYGFRRCIPGMPELEMNSSRYKSVMFAGCSVTEGIGLPHNHIWHSFLHKKLSYHCNKIILPYNFGKGGVSIDATIRFVYNTIQHRNFNPEMVCLMLPPLGRQEFIVKIGDWTIWNMLPQFPPSNKEFIEIFDRHVETNMRQLVHNCFRNLLLLKWMLHSRNIPWYFGFWANDLSENYLAVDAGQCNEADLKIPDELTEHYLPVHIRNERELHSIDKKFQYTIARDYLHYGPNSHVHLADQVYSELLKKDSFKELLIKWGNA